MWIIHLDAEIDQSEIKSQTERSILSRCLVPQLMCVCVCGGGGGGVQSLEVIKRDNRWYS